MGEKEPYITHKYSLFQYGIILKFGLFMCYDYGHYILKSKDHGFYLSLPVHSYILGYNIWAIQDWKFVIDKLKGQR